MLEVSIDKDTILKASTDKDTMLKEFADKDTHLHYKKHDPHTSDHTAVSSPRVKVMAENKRVQKPSL
jgi:hypothetical protein